MKLLSVVLVLVLVLVLSACGGSASPGGPSPGAGGAGADGAGAPDASASVSCCLHTHWADGAEMCQCTVVRDSAACDAKAQSTQQYYGATQAAVMRVDGC